jgi:predicted ATP-binding protein involved in virulence
MNSKALIICAVLFAVILAFTIVPVDYYNEKNPVLDEIRKRLTKINPKYGKIPLRTGNKSYTEDKSAITLCIKDEKGQYYNIDVLMYVTLHEVAHMLTKAEGDDSHGEEFKQNFAKLLSTAANKGVYNPTQPIPESYCGVDH